MRITIHASKQDILTCGKTLEMLREQINAEVKQIKPKSMNVAKVCNLYNLQKLHLMFAEKAMKFVNAPMNKSIQLSIDSNQLRSLDEEFIDDLHPVLEAIVTRQIIDKLKKNLG